MLRPTFKVISLGDRHAFIKLSARVAVITQSLKRAGKGGRRARLVSAYFGFNTQDEAVEFVARLRRYFPSAYCQVRKGQRLEAAFEVKVREFKGLEMFTWEVATPAAAVPEQAKAELPKVEVAIASNVASNVVQFGRSRPKQVAGRSID